MKDLSEIRQLMLPKKAMNADFKEALLYKTFRRVNNHV